MTRSEACEILGISENASLTMAKAAYKILRQEATTEVQTKVLATAFNVFQGVLKDEGDQNKPSTQKSAPRAKPTNPHPKATPNVPAAKSKKPNSLKTKSREVALRSNSAIASDTNSPDGSPRPKIEVISFKGLPTLEPSRVYKAVTDDVESLSGFIRTASKSVRRQLGPTLRNWSTAVLPGERHFLSAGETGCYKWDLHSGKVLGRIGSYNLYDMFSVRVSENGNLALVTGISNGIELLNVETGKKVAFFKGHDNWTRDAIFLPGDQEFVSVGWDGMVIRWNIASGTQTIIGELTGSVLNQVEYLSDQDSVATVCGSGLINVWKLDESRSTSVAQAWSKEPSQAHTTFATSADGKLAVSCTDEWATFKDGYVDHREPVCLTAWDLEASPKQMKRVPLPHRFEAIALSPDGQTLLTGNSNEIFLWDMASMQPIKELNCNPLGVTSLNFAPSGDYVLATGIVPEIKMWRL